MPNDPLKKYKQDYFLLLEAGFLAVNDADEDSALKLFRAAQLLKPEAAFPKLGVAYLHFCKLEIVLAINKLNEVLAIEPDNEIAKTLLGLCLTMSEKTMMKGESLLEATLVKSREPGMKNLLNTAIDFVDKFLKKEPSPMHPQKPKHPPRK